MTQLKTVLCMRWGALYPAAYVNVLYNAVSDNLTGPFRFVCLTNETEGFHPEIETFPIPDMGLSEHAFRSGAWPKISVLKKELYDITGRVLFIDLDTFICGNLDPFFEMEGQFIAIGPDTWNISREKKPWLYSAGKKLLKRFRRKKVVHHHGTSDGPRTQTGKVIGGNSMGTGIFAFDAGSLHHVYDQFMADQKAAFRDYIFEQHFIEYQLDRWSQWPKNSVASFKYHLRRPLLLDIFLPPPPPPLCSPVLAFHGDPRPLNLAQFRVSSRRELPHVWFGPVRWAKEYWDKYNKAG